MNNTDQRPLIVATSLEYVISLGSVVDGYPLPTSLGRYLVYPSGVLTPLEQSLRSYDLVAERKINQ